MKELGCADLFEDDAPEIAPVDLPKGRVHVLALSSGELQKMMPALREDGRDVTVDWVIACACNAHGERLFTPEDFQRLSDKRGGVAVLRKIAKAALQLNGMTTSDSGKAE